MSVGRPRDLRAVLPLGLLSVVVVLVATGAARGLWVGNLHNGLLALSLSGVGVHVLRHRPAHPEGRLMLTAGTVEAVVYLGRQVGHAPGSPSAVDDWWGWLGVWPVAIALALTTLAVVCFPDGRLPSPRWRWVAGAVLVTATACAALSLRWPVEYAATGIVTDHPLSTTAPDLAQRLWSMLAHPTYVAFQLLWVVALVQRWRCSDGVVRRQVAWVGTAAAGSLVVLIVGLVTTGSPVAGLVAVVLVPVTAGWSITHARNASSYSALSWISRAGDHPEDLPDGLARAAAHALDAEGAALWMGSAETLHAVGLWPSDAHEPTRSLDSLVQASDHAVRPLLAGGVVVGALTVRQGRAGGLMPRDDRLLDDLAAQAGLVVAHLDLGHLVARESRSGSLADLTPRERDVLALMARGTSNAAIGGELHLSVKTVEPVVGSIFAKLDLHPDVTSNRRVLAVLAYVRARAVRP